MEIKDLEVRQSNVDIVVEVVEVGEAKEFQKFGRSGKVATAKVKDETGEMNLSLWNEQVDQVKPGAKLRISNGYVNEFQGEKQLTTGKFGKLEVIEGIPEDIKKETEAEGAKAAEEELKKEGAEAPKEEGVVEKVKDVVEDVKEKVEDVVEAVEEKLHLKKKPEEEKKEEVKEEKVE
ncbi:hypothetical protein KY332_00530 [Candidatus Woesearchaeota archaeon]|nr:hypothetical protein [Candidatus Woesearchaeota archaeon]